MHEQAAQRHLLNLASTPEGAQVMHLAYTGVHGRWADDYLSMIGQHFMYSTNSQWPLEQVVSFGRVHHRIEAGELGRIPIRAGGHPWSDKEREHNALLLADLPHPFVAELDMTQNCADSDGLLRWTEPVEVQVATGRTEASTGVGARAVLANAIIRPGSVPLEVGYTMPSRTALHAHEDRGVARWPYHSDWIWLIVSMAHFAPGPEDDVRRCVEADRDIAVAG
jgi:hypothetical protein